MGHFTNSAPVCVDLLDVNNYNSYNQLGGLFTAIFIEAAKHLFTFFVALKLYKLGAVYGPISAFITFLMWVFYAVSIFLIGAEVVHNLGDCRKPG